MELDETDRIELVRSVGLRTFGNDWQSPFARLIERDSSIVRKWLARKRAVPDWVIRSLPALVNQVADKRLVEAAELKAYAKQLEGDFSK